MNTKMDPVVHFELPSDDPRRMSNFYASAFGWQLNMMGEDMDNYVLATTTETDKNGMVKTPGTINGGFFPRDKGKGGYPSVVIGVDDIKEKINEVKQAGGEVIDEPVEIPGVGWYVSFKDTEGNILSLMQSHRK